MSDIAIEIQKAFLNHCLGKSTWTAPVEWWVALYTIMPDDDTIGTEISGSWYNRILCTDWTFATSTRPVTVENSAIIEYEKPTELITGIVGFAVHSSESGNNLILWDEFSSPLSCSTNNNIRFEIGALKAQLYKRGS